MELKPKNIYTIKQMFDSSFARSKDNGIYIMVNLLNKRRS